MAEFPQKYLKLIGDFAESAQSMSATDLEQELIKAERALSAVEKEMNADVKLTAAKQEVQNLAREYKETMASYVATIKYIVYVLEERGIALKDDTTTEND